MRLRAKIILTVVIVLSLLGGLSFTFFLHVIMPSFLEVEEKNAVNDMQRVVSAIQSELDHLNSLNHDWAASDVSYDFMVNRSEKYIADNLPLSSFKDNLLNAIYFYDVKGELVWGESHDLETGEFLHLQEFSAESLPRRHPLLNFAYDKYPLATVFITGILITERGPLLISSRPIINNENQGPVRGVLIMGRLLNSTVIKYLAEQTGVQFDMLSLGPDSMTQSLRDVLKALSPEQPVYLDKISNARLMIYTRFADIKGNLGFLIRVHKKREIFRRSQAVMAYTIFSIVLGIFLVMVILSLLMQKIVLGPIASLTRHVLAIRHSGDLSSQLKVQGSDEVGLLTEEFNLMITRLHETKHKLQEQYFQLGMAELASGIMHNVRNTLHILSGEIEKTTKSMEKIPLQKIMMARHDIGIKEVSEEKRADLIKFLDTTNTRLVEFISRTNTNLQEITPLIRETENIFLSFEKWAYSERIDEVVLLESIIHEAYQFLQANYRETISFIIDSGIRDAGRIKANRLILMQIFIHLLTNAAESIGREEEEQGEILVNGTLEDRGPDQAVHIRIRDNGAGMSREILAKIFNRGFTTKKEGNTGLGLHWCANAIASLQGELYAESKGPGKGACFHLVIPKKMNDYKELTTT